MNDRPVRLQLRRTKGWRLPPNARICARPTKYGNPYAYRTRHALARMPAADLVTPWEFEGRCSADGAEHQMVWPGGEVTNHTVRYMTVEECVATHRRALIAPTKSLRLYHRRTCEYITVDLVRAELAGRDLACWCQPDRPCHVDTLLWVANAPLDDVEQAVAAEYQVIAAMAERVAQLHPEILAARLEAPHAHTT